MKSFEDYVKGGIADNMSVEDVANKHRVSVESINHQLSIGIDVEMEHVDNKRVAREIALDHLVEDPLYYTKLKKAKL